MILPEPVFRRIGCSATPADIFQPCIHQRILGADRIHIFGPIGFCSRGFCRRRGSRFCRRSGQGDLVVAGQPGARVRYRFAFRRLGDCSLRNRAKRDENGKMSHFDSLAGRRDTAMKWCNFQTNCDYSVKSKRLSDSFAKCTHSRDVSIDDSWTRKHLAGEIRRRPDRFFLPSDKKRIGWFYSAEQKRIPGRSSRP